MPEAAFIGVGGARTVCHHFGAAGPGQAGRGLDCLCRGTDGRHHDGSLLVIAGKRGAASEHSGDVGQLGRGEGNDGIGAIGVGREEPARVRVPARGQIHGNHGGSRIAFQQVAAGDRQTAHGGTKAGAQDRVDKELSTLQEAFAGVTVQVGFFRQ